MNFLRIMAPGLCPRFKAVRAMATFFNINIEIQVLWAWSEFNGYAS